MRTRTELRGEILAAARAEFAQYGLAGARIDRIARAANASKERLYAHFGDKETLFRDVVATDGLEFFRAVELRPDAVPEFVVVMGVFVARHAVAGKKVPDIATRARARGSFHAIPAEACGIGCA